MPRQRTVHGAIGTEPAQPAVGGDQPALVPGERTPRQRLLAVGQRLVGIGLRDRGLELGCDLQLVGPFRLVETAEELSALLPA